jgi:hypothetical protein
MVVVYFFLNLQIYKFLDSVMLIEEGVLTPEDPYLAIVSILKALSCPGNPRSNPLFHVLLQKLSIGH